MKHISICLILLMGLFVGCSDDDTSSDWTITMTVDLPQADTVALGFIRSADHPLRINWGTNSGETQYENKRYYSPSVTILPVGTPSRSTVKIGSGSDVLPRISLRSM